jgi:hypothetical protein
LKSFQFCFFEVILDFQSFYSFLRFLRHDFCSIVSNERLFIQNHVRLSLNQLKKAKN